MHMYRARFGKIEMFEVVRTTANQVRYINERGGESRESKLTGWYSWHESWDAAKEHLVNEAQDNVDSLRIQLERAKGELGNRKGMKAPANTQIQRAP